MAEATLRGYIEIPTVAAKALIDAGWPVETRYFVPKHGTLAANNIGTIVKGTTPKRRSGKTGSGGKFLGLGDKTPEELGMSKGRRHYGDRAQEILMHHEEGVMRSAELYDRLMKTPYKPADSRHAVRMQVIALTNHGVLKDYGDVPPKLMGVEVARKVKK